jgi:hypothetical protein
MKVYIHESGLCIFDSRAPGAPCSSNRQVVARKMENQKKVHLYAMAKGEKVDSNHGNSNQQSIHFYKHTFG